MEKTVREKLEYRTVIIFVTKERKIFHEWIIAVHSEDAASYSIIKLDLNNFVEVKKS